MNGIGNAFIWTAIACGPFFLAVIGVIAAERIVRKALLPAHRRRKH